MVSVDNAFEVRYKKGGEQFEVLVDFDKLNEFKKNSTEMSVYDVLADTKIFKDQRRGEIASENIVKKIFPKMLEEEIIKEILTKGECQIPTSFLNKLRDKKKVQVINYIAENSINPVTKSKYTYSMIESEVNKIKYSFKHEISFKNQAKEVLDILKKSMPITISKIILIIKVPGEFCGNFYGGFRKYGEIRKESFDDNGNLHLHIEINESILDEVINFVKGKSNNSAEYHVQK